jgi:phosphatidylglycerophosphate synthase
MRRVSPHVTRLLLYTPLTPNGVTALMTPVGLAAAAVLTLPGILPAVGALLLIQVQLLLDCCDGELARWRGRFSATGIYLDRVAHYVTESALPIALGIRADGGWDHVGGWTTLGLAVAVLVLLIKSETSLIHVARAEAGQPPARDVEEVAAPRPGGLRRARRMLSRLPFFRAFVAVEFTLLAMVAAVVDPLAGELDGTRVLLTALVPIAIVTVVGHLAAVLASSRLR